MSSDNELDRETITSQMTAITRRPYHLSEDLLKDPYFNIRKWWISIKGDYQKYIFILEKNLHADLTITELNCLLGCVCSFYLKMVKRQRKGFKIYTLYQWRTCKNFHKATKSKEI